MVEHELVDPGSNERLVQRMTAISKQGEIHELSRQDGLPEDVMSVLEPYVGDGKASVTVGAELASSVEFGYKAQAFVSMTATCNNNLDDMAAVAGILKTATHRLVQSDHEEIGAIRDQMLPSNRNAATAPAVAVQKAPTVKPAALPTKATHPTVVKPSFRR